MDAGVLFLGALQGVTEFLPVSSSGHLALAQIVLGWQEPPLSYDLTLHGATTLATILYFARDLVSLSGEWVSGFGDANARNSVGWRIGWAVILGTIVTAAVGLPMKPVVKAALGNSLAVGAGLCVTGGLLLLASFIRRDPRELRGVSGLFVGLAQGIATLPGVSRSGSTIVAGLLSGLSREEAFRFSFLLSIPAILGAVLLEIGDVGGGAAFVRSLPPGWWAGDLAAFFVGLASLALLRRIVIVGRWWIFGVYCLVVGGGTVAFSFLGAF
jgi:undecaprenyl-diphosphatase